MKSTSNICDRLVLVRGAGDLATGVAHRLHQCGFPVVMLEAAKPTVIRRTVAFANAVFTGRMTVEGVTAVRVNGAADCAAVIRDNHIPVLADSAGQSIRVLAPEVLVDAILAKKNLGTAKEMAPLVIGLGPGFTAGVDVHAVVETMRGHDLGRVIWSGAAQADTGVPGPIQGYAQQRLLRAPAAGIWQAEVSIGDRVEAGQVVARVNDAAVRTAIGGVVRGLLYDGLAVKEGMKVGDVDPRPVREHCFTISDKARAVGGGVLEAMMSRWCRGELK